MERIKAAVEATAEAPKRTVTVTPVFEAVTERMLTANVVAEATFVAAGDLAGGVGLGMAQPAAPIKTRIKEVGFQVLTGSAATLLESLQAGASGGVLGFAACAPQACQEIYLAWKDHDCLLYTSCSEGRRL